MAEQDLLRRFLFEGLNVRGLWVRLSTSWTIAQKHQECASDVRYQLGEALSAVVLLSSTIKFKGALIMQAQGDGALKTLVAQSTHDRKIRGLIRSSQSASAGSLVEMFGEGRLVITISPEKGEPYQGIVALQGDNLAAVLETYFAQSEQLNTRLWLFANDKLTTGLLLQELPGQQQFTADWERIEMLANTITEREMLSLACEDLLHRLFHEEKVRLFDGETVEFDCSCSQAKIENMLRLLGREELESILLEQGKVDVNCEFCNQHYRFDNIDVEQLLRLDVAIPASSQVKH